MKQSLGRLAGNGLAAGLLSAVLVSGGSRADAAQLMLTLSGVLGGYPFADMQPEEATTLGGVPLESPNKLFTFRGVFDTAARFSSGWAGDNLFPLLSFSMTIDGVDYTGTPNSNINVLLGDPDINGFYAVGITDANGTNNWNDPAGGNPTGIVFPYHNASPNLDVTSPTVTLFSNCDFWVSTGPYNIPLNVPGGLQLNDNAWGYALVWPASSPEGTVTASLSAVPEPSSAWLLSLGAGGLLLRRRSRAR